MSNTTSNKQQPAIKVKTIFLSEPVRYRGDINELVSKYFDENFTHGIILHKPLPKNTFLSLVNMIKQIKYINWIYVSDSRKEICLFTLNYKGFRKNYNIEELKKEFSKILSIDVEDIFIYPVKNILNILEPKFAKDAALKRKPVWDWGRLGKKEYRQKFTRMRKKILYSNLKR